MEANQNPAAEIDRINKIIQERSKISQYIKWQMKYIYFLSFIFGLFVLFALHLTWYAVVGLLAIIALPGILFYQRGELGEIEENIEYQRDSLHSMLFRIEEDPNGRIDHEEVINILARSIKKRKTDERSSY